MEFWALMISGQDKAAADRGVDADRQYGVDVLSRVPILRILPAGKSNTLPVSGHTDQKEATK
jgi:hypothetical protein